MINKRLLFGMGVLGGFVISAGLGFAQDEESPPRLDEGQASQIFSISKSKSKSKSDQHGKGDPGAVMPPAVQPAGYRDLLKKVTPTVVSVFPERLMSPGGDASDPLSRFFGIPKKKGEGNDDEKKEDDPDEENERMGVGSGVILSADGWIVTNSHVVHLATGKLADAVSVELSDRRVFAATIVGADSLTDLALLKIEADDLEFLPVADSDEVMTGDLVFAVGNPFKLGMTATMGMVSATRRSSLKMNGEGGFESFIQTDAAINPGNSGGALVDARGRLVGINTAIYGPYRGNVGIGFAVPTQLMSRVVSELAQHGEMQRGFFGIQIEEIDQKQAEAAGLEEIAGVWIADVMKGGPADVAGVASGVVITEANGRSVPTREDLRVELSFVRPGGKIELTVAKEGAVKKLTVTAAEGPSSENDSGELFTLDAMPGVKFRIGDSGGLEIVEIAEDSKASGDQLAVGMVISSINGTAITSSQDANSAIRKGVNKVVVILGGAKRTLALRLE